MLPVSVLSSAEPRHAAGAGPYAIVLRGAGGAELARYPFTPGGLDEGAAPYEGVENKTAYISELVPYTPGIASLEIEGPAGVLFQVEAGLSSACRPDHHPQWGRGVWRGEHHRELDCQR